MSLCLSVCLWIICTFCALCSSIRLSVYLSLPSFLAAVLATIVLLFLQLRLPCGLSPPPPSPSVPDEALTGPKEELLLPGVQSEADIANDRTSLNRRLTEKLILLVRDAAGVWQLPSAPYASESDPGLRQVKFEPGWQMPFSHSLPHLPSWYFVVARNPPLGLRNVAL